MKNHVAIIPNIINVESFVRRRNSIACPDEIASREIGRICRKPDYKYEIIILDNSSSSLAREGI